MHTYPVSLVKTVVAYDALLQRYARRLIHHEAITGLLVAEAFQQYYLETQRTEVVDVRELLRKNVLKLCEYWLKYQKLKECAMGEGEKA